MMICGYFFATVIQGAYESHSGRRDTVAISLCFAFLYLVGAVGAFFVLFGSRWARFVLSIVALLTVTASVVGLFAFFNSLPFSVVGIAFDIFALASVVVLSFPPKHAAP